MIIIKLRGGIGNQLFQYAFGRKLAELKNTELKFDISGYKKNYRKFALNELIENLKTAGLGDYAVLALKNLKSMANIAGYLIDKDKFGNRLPVLIEKNLAYDKRNFECPRDVYAVGYWQSENYFKDIEDVLKKEISLKTPLENENLNLAGEIVNSESVCVHIRAGDYLTDVINKNIGVCPEEYYRSAVKKITEAVKQPKFFVFSDDVNTAKKRFNFNVDSKFVSGNENHSYIDLHLMSLCKHFITANSSFSWWGAWLSESRNKNVFCPSPWCKNSNYDPVDIQPSSWNSLPVKLI